MKLLPNTASARITLAVALSLLVHALLLFGPKLIELPPLDPPLPPLIARLEPLPRAPAKPIPKKPTHKAHVPSSKLAPVAKIAIAQPEAAATQPEAAATQPEAAVIETAPLPETPEADSQPAHPLPRHAQLTFTVYKGVDFPIGEARHKLEIDNDHHYTLQTNIRTVGLASLIKTFDMNQKSTGTISAQGMRPDEYTEGRVSDRGNQALTARFDWDHKMLDFSSGDTAALPLQAQDMLSFLYQLSQLPLDQPTVPIYISNGKKLEKYDLAVGTEEYILTRNGKMRALPLRKIHAPGEEGLEVWLGMEYRLLPVKIRQIDRNGEIAGEMVITDIRVSDE